jgi:hypothetical protein
MIAPTESLMPLARKVKYLNQAGALFFRCDGVFAGLAVIHPRPRSADGATILAAHPSAGR